MEGNNINLLDWVKESEVMDEFLINLEGIRFDSQEGLSK